MLGSQVITYVNNCVKREFLGKPTPSEMSGYQSFCVLKILKRSCSSPPTRKNKGTGRWLRNSMDDHVQRVEARYCQARKTRARGGSKRDANFSTIEGAFPFFFFHQTKDEIKKKGTMKRSQTSLEFR